MSQIDAQEILEVIRAIAFRERRLS